MPGSRRCEVVGPYGDAWKVRVTAAPEKGKANVELCAFLAGLLGVNCNQVAVVAGARSRDKLVEVRGICSDAVVRALAAAAGNGYG